MDKTLKYKELIERKELTNCPFSHCSEITIPAYRWTYEVISDDRNFIPKMVLDGNAPIRRNSNTDEFRCSCCGLSMFISEESARKKFNGIPLRNRVLLGYSHLAKGLLTPSIGLSGKHNSEGHFDLFEYEGVELSNVFEIIGPI